MSEEVADLRRQLARMTTQLQRLESASRQTWQMPMGNKQDRPNIFAVIGGNTLPAGATIGIVARSDAVTVGEFTAGSGGTGIVNMPAFPVPALPNGVGSAQNLSTGEYVFALIDSRSPYSSDAPEGRQISLTSAINYDVIVGPVTYRYICWIVGVGL